LKCFSNNYLEKRKDLLIYFDALSSKKKILKMIKQIKTAIAIVFAIIIITNPSLSNFEDFAPSQFNDSKYMIDKELQSSRLKNYFVYSIYEVSVTTIRGNFYYKEVDRYYGVLGNFYFINRRTIKLID
jgi:hypothetical protein